MEARLIYDARSAAQQINGLMPCKPAVFLSLAAAFLFSWAALNFAEASETEKTRSVNIIGAGKSAPDSVTENPPENTAGLSIEILPRDQIKAGEKVVFKVSAKKEGYLILIDVDAEGRVTQIFPNLYSVANPGSANMLLPSGATVASNLLKPGKMLSIPDQKNPLARFEYVVEPPSGQGVIVALLSIKPVHMVDIPDVPPESLAAGGAAHYVYDAAKTLRLAEPNADLIDPQWSFDAKVYSITQ